MIHNLLLIIYDSSAHIPQKMHTDALKFYHCGNLPEITLIILSLMSHLYDSSS